MRRHGAAHGQKFGRCPKELHEALLASSFAAQLQAQGVILNPNGNHVVQNCIKQAFSDGHEIYDVILEAGPAWRNQHAMLITAIGGENMSIESRLDKIVDVMDTEGEVGAEKREYFSAVWALEVPIDTPRSSDETRNQL